MGYSFQKGFGWPHILFALVLVVVLAGIFLSPGFVFNRSGGGARTEALNNAKAIAGGLVAFKEEYGSYPSAESLEEILKNHDFRSHEYENHNVRNADDANAYLSQLIVTEIIDSETFFYASGVKGAIKGDDIIGTADKLLAKGENSFAYIMAKGDKPLKDVKSITPLVIAPIIKSDGEVPRFDPHPYADYYVYGCVDGSGKIGKISPEGLPLSKGRTHLFQTGTDSLFGDETPIVKYPLGF